MIFTYTRTGDRHINRLDPCDDSVRAVQYGNYSLLFLSDGCGSSRYSSEAAHRITKRLADYFTHPIRLSDSDDSCVEDLLRYCVSQNNEQEFLRFIIDEIIDETEEMCQLYQCGRSDLCCTLISTLIEYNPKTGKNTAVTITVGDGFVATYHKKSKTTSLVSRGENKDNNPNMTYFCTSFNAIEHANVYRIENFDSLLISSDGITHVVNIDNPDEMHRFMHSVSKSAIISDAMFAEKMNRLLSTYVKDSSFTKDLEDDCSIVYYSTDKKRSR